jgi:hypothetical protein
MKWIGLKVAAGHPGITFRGTRTFMTGLTNSGTALMVLRLDQPGDARCGTG